MFTPYLSPNTNHYQCIEYSWFEFQPKQKHSKPFPLTSCCVFLFVNLFYFFPLFQLINIRSGLIFKCWMNKFTCYSCSLLSNSFLSIEIPAYFSLFSAHFLCYLTFGLIFAFLSAKYWNILKEDYVLSISRWRISFPRIVWFDESATQY